jgi:hypothetical protein
MSSPSLGKEKSSLLLPFYCFPLDSGSILKGKGKSDNRKRASFVVVSELDS